MRPPLAVAAALVCVSIAGCSSSAKPHAALSQQSVGSSTESSAIGGTISSAAYRAKANAICAAGTKRSDALGNGPGDPTRATAAQLPLFVKYLTDQGRVVSDELKDLRALPLPADGAPGAVSAYAHLATALAHLNTAIAAARAGNLRAYNAAVAAVADDTDAANKAAVAAGLTVCGS